MALAPARAWAMVDAARDAHRTLAVVHNYYFMPDYSAVKQILDQGTIGRPYLVILNLLSVEDRPGAAEYQPVWRHDARVSGGGVLMDMLHVLYLLPWLMGQPIRSVSAATDRRLGTAGSVEDVALCRFAFDFGYGLINIAWGDGPGGIEVMGTEGRLLLLYDAFGTGPFRRPEQLHVYRGTERLPIDLELGPRPGRAADLAELRPQRRRRRDAAGTGEEGCAVLESVIATYASAARQTTVPLPLDRANPVFAGAWTRSSSDATPVPLWCRTGRGTGPGRTGRARADGRGTRLRRPAGRRPPGRPAGAGARPDRRRAGDEPAASGHVRAEQRSPPSGPAGAGAGHGRPAQRGPARDRHRRGLGSGRLPAVGHPVSATP